MWFTFIWSECFLNFVTREGGSSTFLFRPTVLVKQVARVECVSEEVAINAFFAFLKDVGPNVVLVGVDEDTVGLDMPATLIMTLSRLAWLCKRWRQRTGQASGALLRATRGGRGSWNTRAWNISRKSLIPVLQFVYCFYSKRPRVRAGDVSQQNISILSTSSIGNVLGSGRHAQVFYIIQSYLSFLLCVTHSKGLCHRVRQKIFWCGLFLGKIHQQSCRSLRCSPKDREKRDNVWIPWSVGGAQQFQDSLLHTHRQDGTGWILT